MLRSIPQPTKAVLRSFALKKGEKNKSRTPKIMALAAGLPILIYLPGAHSEVILSDPPGFSHYFNFSTTEAAFSQCYSFVEQFGKPHDDCFVTEDLKRRFLVWAGAFGIRDMPGYPGFSAHDLRAYINKCTLPSVYNESTADCGNDEQK